MNIQKYYIQILCLSALFHSSIFTMRSTGVRVPTVPSSWMAKGFSYGVTPEGQAVPMPRATANPQIMSQVRAEMQQQAVTPSSAPWTMQQFIPTWMQPKVELVENALSRHIKELLRKYDEHISWLNSEVEQPIKEFFLPLLTRYDLVYENFAKNPMNEKAQETLSNMQSHMDEFIKQFRMNRPTYLELAALPQDFINNDQDTLQIRNHGLNGMAKMEKVLRNYKFGNSEYGRIAVLQRSAAAQKYAGAGAQSGAFKTSGTQRMFKTTTPRLMSRQEAAQILGISENASPEDVKIAYRKAALKAHPDAGGSTKAMQDLNNAKETLLSQQASASAASSGNYQQHMDLYDAVSSGNLDLVRTLINTGANVNAQGRMGYTILQNAFMMSNAEIIKVLINAGADVNDYSRDSFSPLKMAVATNRADIVKMLIDAGAHINEKDSNGYTPLDLAIRRKFTDIEKILRAHGAKQSSWFSSWFK